MGIIGYRRHRESDSLITAKLEDAVRRQREKVEEKARVSNEQRKAEGKPEKAIVWKPAKRRVDLRPDGIEDVALDQEYDERDGPQGPP